MSFQNITLKYCSLFPAIDFTQVAGFCTLSLLAESPLITNVELSGSYKRLNAKGQVSNHVIQSIIQRRYKLTIWHTESVNISLFQTSDSVTLTDDLGNIKTLRNISIESQKLANLQYETVITGTIYDEFNEVCNLSSDYVLAKNTADINNLVNSLVSVVDKPSYVGVMTTTDSGTKARFTLPYSELLNNIVVADYLYVHSNFDFESMGMLAVQLITKTSSLLTFEGSVNYTTYTAETNRHITLNFEPSFETDVLVVERSLTTTLYTDFVPKFSTQITTGGKNIEVAQKQTLATEKIYQDILTVPLIVIDSDLWKIKQMYKADSLSFVAQTGSYYNINNLDYLTEKGNANLFGVKEYEANIVYNQEVSSTNK